MDENATQPRLWPGVIIFSANYTRVHGYLSIVICSFGIVSNVFNIVVLSQRHMRTPTNCILTALAVADTLTMICYVPFASHFYISYSPDSSTSPYKNSKLWMGFLLFHGSFTATTHTVSIWMGVLLAVFRYRHIQSPAKGYLTRMRRLIRSRLVVVLICMFSVIILIPNYMSYKLVLSDVNVTTYAIEDLNVGTNQVSVIMHANMWIYGIMAKLLPCILMVFYGWRLLDTLQKRHIHIPKIDPRRKIIYRRSVKNNRTTRMLIVVLVLFLVTEFPQAVIVIISILVPRVFDDVYVPLGDVMDVTALTNNSINFALYCVMSTQFRKTFLSLFCRRRRTDLSIRRYSTSDQLGKLTL